MKDQGQYWKAGAGGGSQPYHYVPAQAFEAAFKETQIGKATAAHLSVPYPKEKSPQGALAHKRNALPTSEMFRAVFEREWLLMKRNAFLYVAQTIQIILIALVTMTVFFRTTLDISLQDGNYYLGAMFLRPHHDALQRLHRAHAARHAPAHLLPPEGHVSVPGVGVGGAHGAALAALLRLGVHHLDRCHLLCHRLRTGTGKVLHADAALLPHPPGGHLPLPPHRSAGPQHGGLPTPSAPSPSSSSSCSEASSSLRVSVALALITTPISPHILPPLSPPSHLIFHSFDILGTHHCPPPPFSLFLRPHRQTAATTCACGRMGSPHPAPTIIAPSSPPHCFHAGDIHNVWILAYWISPLMYGQNALAVNEFLAPRWNVVSASTCLCCLDAIPNWIGLTASSDSWACLRVAHPSQPFLHLYPPPVPARTPVQSGGSPLSPYGPPWAGAAGEPLATTDDRWLGIAWARPQPVVSEEQLETKHAARTGEVLGTAGGSRKRSTRQGKGTSSALDRYCTSHTASRGEGFENGFTGVTWSHSPSPPKASTAWCCRSQPHSLSFHNVNYFVDMPAEMRAEGAPPTRACSCCETCRAPSAPRLLTALVGVSGAGKTTLMDVAGGAEDRGVTVHESLLFSAWLRLPADVDVEVREEFVEEVMELVELDSLRDAMVGLPGVNGLSTEQRKRLTIAVELLLLMKRGGEVIYMGPLGTDSRLMIDYFQAIPGVPPIRAGYNPATWNARHLHPSHGRKTQRRFCRDTSHNQTSSRRNEELIESLKTPPPGQQDLAFATKFSTSYPSQFCGQSVEASRNVLAGARLHAVRYFFLCHHGAAHRAKFTQSVIASAPACLCCSKFRCGGAGSTGLTLSPGPSMASTPHSWEMTTTLKVPGETPDPTVQVYLEEVFGYQHSWLGYVVLVNIGFIILFFTVFAYALKKLNFQNR
ncbi:unnamed protein product [Closterium sp. NIES-65]|nr:unnamed protein product [Closterium sp. NIES-65]